MKKYKVNQVIKLVQLEIDNNKLNTTNISDI